MPISYPQISTRYSDFWPGGLIIFVFNKKNIIVHNCFLNLVFVAQVSSLLKNSKI